MGTPLFDYLPQFDLEVFGFAPKCCLCKRVKDIQV